jgi:hypothetical protein
MTELEEEGLTGGQGPALSKHRTGTAYRGHAKDTEKRVLRQPSVGLAFKRAT